LREEEEPKESPLRDERCAATGSTVHALSMNTASVTRRDRKIGLLLLAVIIVPRQGASAPFQR